MKFLGIIFPFLLLLSCKTTEIQEIVQTREVGNNNEVHFFYLSNDDLFIALMPDIEESIRDALQKCSELYPIEGLYILVKSSSASDDWRIIPDLGVGGAYLNSSAVEIAVDLDFHDLETLINHNIPVTLYHEIGHIIHFRNRTPTGTLFEIIASEGLADHFEMILSGGEPQPWSTNLKEDQLKHYMDLARQEIWSRDFDYDWWFFGNPSFIGYSLGFKMINDYMADHPELTIIDLMKLPDEELYDSIEF